MSWSSSEEVAQLIHVARVEVNVDPIARKSADLTLLDLVDNAINIGDSLVAVACNANWPFPVRFNAALALDALLTQQGWREGHKFSDKDAALCALTQLALSSECAGPHRKLHRTAVDGVCAIAALDFPTDQWVAFIHERGTEATAPTQPPPSALSSAWIFLLQLTEIAYRNASLWWHLANHVAPALLGGGLVLPPSSSLARTCDLCFTLRLLQRRPRPSEEHEIATPENCFLLSSAFSNLVTTELGHCAGRIASDAAGEERAAEVSPALAASVRECSLLAGLAQRLMRSSQVASTAFGACATVLVAVQPHHSSGSLRDVEDSVTATLMSGCALGSLVENCLECLLSALQTFPEVSAASGARELLSCLLFYMVDTDDATETTDASDLESTLKQLLADDETVPLGCEGGDDPSIACSVLELFLDSNRTQLYAASTALLAFAKLQLAEATPRASAWRALSRALTSIGRVCEEADVSYVAALPQEHILDLLATFAAALSRQTSAPTMCLLLFALSKSFALGGPPEFLAGWHSVLTGTFDLWLPLAATAPSESHYVFCTVLWALGNLLQAAAADLTWMTGIGGSGPLPVLLEWRERAQSVLAGAQSTLIIASVGHVWLLLARLTVSSPPSFEQWAHTCQIVAGACSVKSVSVLLKDILTTSRELERFVGGNSAETPLTLSPRLAECVESMVVQLDPSRAQLVLRALALFVVDLVRDSDQRGASVQPFDSFLCACGMSVVRLCANDATFADDATCRSFACGLSAVVITRRPEEGPCDLVCGAYDCTARMLAAAHATLCSFTTLHTLSAALSVQALAYPSLLDRPATVGVLDAVFATPNWLSAQRPVAGFTGCTLLLSLWLLQDPSRCAQFLARPPGLTAAALGWWASLAVFSDETCVVFYLAACAKLVLTAVSGGAASMEAFARPLAENNVYVLPSFRSRRPTAVHRGLSLLASMACGLALVRSKWQKTVKVPSNDALTLTRRTAADAWASLHQELARIDGLRSPAMTTTVIEAATLIEQHMSTLGLANVVSEAQQIV